MQYDYDCFSLDCDGIQDGGQQLVIAGIIFNGNCFIKVLIKNCHFIYFVLGQA